jgi:DNA-directed RNA polymerase subunit E'/Rpb7
MEIKYQKKKDARINSIYSRGLLTRNVVLTINNVGSALKETLENYISYNYEGKCVTEGFIKHQSTKILTFSSGEITRGNVITFVVTFECEICFPVEGMLISCIAKNITKAGIKAESSQDQPSPIVVFVAKDHNYNNDLFSEIKVDDTFTIRVIGQRFELNDSYVSVLGELTKPAFVPKDDKRPRIVIEK